MQVSVIKAKISTEFGMPSGKQKLQIGVSMYTYIHAECMCSACNVVFLLHTCIYYCRASISCFDNQSSNLEAGPQLAQIMF